MASRWIATISGVVALAAVAYSRRAAQRAASELHALQQSVLRLCSAESSSLEWRHERENVAALLHQGNTYSTWSLSLAGMQHVPLLYGTSDNAKSGPSLAPATLGVTASSTPKFLKALDLGGGPLLLRL